MIGPQSVRLVGRLYDTALDEKAWSDLSTEIARGFDGNSGVVQVQTAEKGSWTEYRAVVPLEADVRADGDIGIIGIHRPRRSGPFNAAAKQELQFLLPHVQRGCRYGSASLHWSSGGKPHLRLSPALRQRPWLCCAIVEYFMRIQRPKLYCKRATVSDRCMAD